MSQHFSFYDAGFMMRDSDRGGGLRRVIDRTAPDKFDLLGEGITFLEVLVIMYAPR
jgi:hypothetical protein